MDIDSLHVVVAGAAFAGSGAALLFARAGARVTVFEKIAEPRAVGAGIGLAENGLAVLESLGLGPAIERIGRPIGTPRIVDGRERVMLAVDGPPPRGLMVRRSALYEVLLDAVAAEPRIEAVFGAEVQRSDPDGTVHVRMPSGEDRKVTADLVIGADGVHSRIREAGDHGACTRRGLSYVRALVDDESLARGEEAWTAGGLFGSFAVPGGTYMYCSAGNRAVRAALAARDLDAFRAAWAAVYPASQSLLAAVERWDQLLVNDVVRVECRRWFDRRQVLVGDAAHAMAPNLGQGANSALVDAAVLLDELRNAPDLATALARYQQRRAPAVARVARAAARLGQLAEITNPAGRWLRDRVVMPIVSRAAKTQAPSLVLQEPTPTLLAIGRASAAR